jgi:prephenate dehydrogenase
MIQIKRIALLGVGLLGGSLGKIWREKRPHLHIIGFGRPQTVAEALALGLIDEATSDIQVAAHDADLVILATPIHTILAHLEAIAPHLKAGAIVTDVGSVKSPIMEKAQKVLKPENPFIGGHPMAGSEKSGPSAADAFLFENATYVLCPPPQYSNEIFESSFTEIIDLIEDTGARILILEAHRHDTIAATISHVPQLIAVSMMNLAASLNQNDPAFLQLAAGGFRDITRIASSAFPMWHDILETNVPAISHAIDQFSALLHQAQTQLHEGALDTLGEAFEDARTVRNTIPKNSKGFLHPLSDVHVFAEDKPGFLFHLTKTIYDHGLNIKDLELLKIREGTGGAFRISFANDTDAHAAVLVLQKSGYSAYRV